MFIPIRPRPIIASFILRPPFLFPIQRPVIITPECFAIVYFLSFKFLNPYIKKFRE